jgi:hypothetical protein
MEGSTETGGGTHHLPPPDYLPGVGVEVDVPPPSGASAAAPPTGVVAGPQGSTGGVDWLLPSQAGAAVTAVADGAANHVDLCAK